MDLTSYTLLGRSGLRVSPIALGAMTFGEQWGWGAARETARAMFDEYVHAGGNFIDTADGYTEGTSESWLGDFMEETSLRERLMIAPKTDYVDLYYLHTWDRLTPVDEVKAAEAGISMVHAALQWLHLRRGVASIIVGATKPAQLRESLSALPPRLSADQIARPDAVSEPARPFPYHMFSNAHQARITGGVEVYGQPPQLAAPDHIPAASAPAIAARGERRTAH